MEERTSTEPDGTSRNYTINSLAKDLYTSNHTAKAWFEVVVEIYGDRHTELYSFTKGKLSGVSQLAFEEVRRLQRACAKKIPIMDQNGLIVLIANRDRIDFDTYKQRRRMELGIAEPVRRVSLGDGMDVLPEPSEEEERFAEEEIDNDNAIQVSAFGDKLAAIRAQFIGNMTTLARQIRQEGETAFIEELTETSTLDSVVGAAKPEAKKSRRKAKPADS